MRADEEERSRRERAEDDIVCGRKSGIGIEGTAKPNASQDEQRRGLHLPPSEDFRGRESPTRCEEEAAPTEATEPRPQQTEAGESLRHPALSEVDARV